MLGRCSLSLCALLALVFFPEQCTFAEEIRPTAKANLSQPVEQGALPVRVHVFEDFETDIEKKWWLRGTLETKNVPPSLSSSLPNRRCLRAATTKDFDRKMGDPNATYKAVVFNPVPGPPMAGNTRLSFRYWIKGTKTLRVQIYSLTNNYHRYLTLNKLPQEKWQSVCVDMTAARRPDGSGGPLAEDERIDDIQFYIPETAELLIDDIILYEAAPKKETRPFPARPLFTGWFDTGVQGKEWPGDFEIVLHEKPLTWDAAKSVINPNTKLPWIRISLRGLRPTGKQTALRFRYKLTGPNSMIVLFHNSQTGKRTISTLNNLLNEKWTEETLVQNTDQPIDEIHFLLQNPGTLLVDDLLLYEPKRE